MCNTFTIKFYAQYLTAKESNECNRFVNKMPNVAEPAYDETYAYGYDGYDDYYGSDYAVGKTTVCNHAEFHNTSRTPLLSDIMQLKNKHVKHCCSEHSYVDEDNCAVCIAI